MRQVYTIVAARNLTLVKQKEKSDSVSRTDRKRIKNFDLIHFFLEDTMGGAGYTFHDLVRPQTEWDRRLKQFAD